MNGAVSPELPFLTCRNPVSFPDPMLESSHACPDPSLEIYAAGDRTLRRPETLPNLVVEQEDHWWGSRSNCARSSLLAAAEISGPYLMVGHSVGGYHARIFVPQKRDQIAGVVLVDSSHPDQEIRSPESPASKQRFRELLRAGRIAMIFGLPRWLGKCGSGGSNFLPRLSF
jgi:hypothetical protein